LPRVAFVIPLKCGVDITPIAVRGQILVRKHSLLPPHLWSGGRPYSPPAASQRQNLFENLMFPNRPVTLSPRRGDPIHHHL
jgi:hypothetical protein